MAPKAEKHAIFDAQTPIFWTQTLAPRRMMELNKALEAIGDKSPQPHRWRSTTRNIRNYGEIATTTATEKKYGKKSALCREK
jgi:hypothetical protein